MPLTMFFLSVFLRVPSFLMSVSVILKYFRVSFPLNLQGYICRLFTTPSFFCAVLSTIRLGQNLKYLVEFHTRIRLNPP